MTGGLIEKLHARAVLTKSAIGVVIFIKNLAELVLKNALQNFVKERTSNATVA